MEKINFALIAKEAQESVENIKDPELRKIAFAKIMDSLLNQSSPAAVAVAYPATQLKKSISKRKNTTEPKVKSSKKGPQSQIKALLDDNFFVSPKTISEVKTELATRGFHIPLMQLSTPLMRLCQQKILRRSKVGESSYSYSIW